MVNTVASQAWGLSVGGVYMLFMGAADSLYVDPGRPCHVSWHWLKAHIIKSLNTYSDFIHGLLDGLPQRPGPVTHQVCDMQALTQGHKLSILVSVSERRRPHSGVHTKTSLPVQTCLCVMTP